MSLSVIAPVFNGVELVAQFTDVMLAQTDLPDAVVFVDDGSRDGTADALRNAARRLKGAGILCEIVSHPENRGRGAARQSGIAAVGTDFVTWLDVDDIFGPMRIARLRSALARQKLTEHDEQWLLSTPYTVCRAGRIGLRQMMPARSIDTFSELYSVTSGPRTLQLQSLAGPTAAFRAEGFDAGLNWSEDLDFILRFLDSGGRIQASDTTDPTLPQAEDVIYFQSFARTARASVEEANRRVYDKNRAIFLRHDIDPDAEFKRKQEGYIARFPARPDLRAAADTADGLQPGTDLQRGSGPQLPMLFDDGASVSFITPYDIAIDPVWDASRSMTWHDIVDAFCRGADRLRCVKKDAAQRVVVNYRITRSTNGLFGLDHEGRMIAPADTAEMLSTWADAMAPSGRFQPVFSRLEDVSAPLFISFFAGAPSYRADAVRLAQQLEKFGVDYQICEFTPNAGIDWSHICRKKISYYSAQRQRHRRPVFWIDVDTKLLGDPRKLGSGQEGDIGAFLRNFNYLPRFDPFQSTRLLHPGYLRFGTGSAVDAFFAHMETVNTNAPDNATDDWVLQEALATFKGSLGFTLFPPSAMVTSDEAARGPETIFQHSDSGNVAAASKIAAQHEARALAPERQLPVLREGARAAMKRGDLREASVFYKRIGEVSPQDTDALIRLLGVYDRLGDGKKYSHHYERAKNDPALRSAALRADMDRLYREEKPHEAARLGQTLIESGSAEDAAFVRSRAFRHGFDVQALARGISKADRVAMMWWEQPFPGNLGDIIGPYVVGALTGIPPRFSKASPRLLSIGSIIRFAKAGDTVWGSGAAAFTQVIDPQARFRAVRGPLTRDLVLKAGAECPEVYGDPAWFLPLIRPCRNVKKTHKLGLIRHFTHEAQPLDVAPDVRQIGILRGSVAEIEAFLDEMNACEAIISTSLHGLIIAQAYGIPAMWAVDTASNRQIHGDGMKFTDYALSVGMPKHDPFDLASVPRIDGSLVAQFVHAPTRHINLRQLADAAPFAVTQEFQALL